MVELERDSRENRILGRWLFPTLIPFSDLFNNIGNLFFGSVQEL